MFCLGILLATGNSFWGSVRLWRAQKRLPAVRTRRGTASGGYKTVGQWLGTNGRKRLGLDRGGLSPERSWRSGGGGSKGSGDVSRPVGMPADWGHRGSVSPRVCEGPLGRPEQDALGAVRGGRLRAGPRRTCDGPCGYVPPPAGVAPPPHVPRPPGACLKRPCGRRSAPSTAARPPPHNRFVPAGNPPPLPLTHPFCAGPPFPFITGPHRHTTAAPQMAPPHRPLTGPGWLRTDCLRQPWRGRCVRRMSSGRWSLHGCTGGSCRNYFFLLRTAPTDHQPPTANRHQPPTATNRQPPPALVEHISYTRSFWEKLCIGTLFFSFSLSLLRTPLRNAWDPSRRHHHHHQTRSLGGRVQGPFSPSNTSPLPQGSV